MRHLKYLKYVIRHKWYVMLACFGRGLFWQGIVHDWSKMLPSEWIPYATYFYGPKYTTDDRRVAAVVCAYFPPTEEEVSRRFDIAWLKHQHRNPHHWQHWVLRNDDGSTVAMEIPMKYVVEMVCDWVCDWEGAGMAINGKRDTREWYDKNASQILLHDETRKIVESLI